jgi:branched-subunit amino acid aminotransferase/4-amino-4-deoxychorismate lyase
MQFISQSGLYGKGIFTTVAIFVGQPLLWEKHWHRLTTNAGKLRIDISEYEERSVADLLAGVIAKNEVKNGRARITFSDESPSEIWGTDGEKKTSLSILTAGRREIPDPFKLTISPHRVNTTSPLISIKSCNYLEHLLAYDEANARGFHEAIRLNERGEVASACMANVFWLKGERLFTPSLDTGCLAGTTREFILENLEYEEVKAEWRRFKVSMQSIWRRQESV